MLSASLSLSLAHMRFSSLLFWSHRLFCSVIRIYHRTSDLHCVMFDCIVDMMCCLLEHCSLSQHKSFYSYWNTIWITIMIHTQTHSWAKKTALAHEHSRKPDGGEQKLRACVMRRNRCLIFDRVGANLLSSSHACYVRTYVIVVWIVNTWNGYGIHITVVQNMLIDDVKLCD